MRNSQDLIIFSKLSKNINRNVVLFNEKIKQQLLKNIIINKVIVAKPYGLKLSQINKDHDYLFNCYKYFLKELSNNLNIIHKTNKDNRYWEIIIGHWLRNFLWTIYNRYKTLINIKKEFDINEVEIINTKKFSYPLNDTFDLNILANDEFFNFVILSFIIKETKIFNYKYSKKKFKKKILIKKKKNYKKNILKEIIGNLGNDIFITDSYIPRKNNLLLQMLVNTFPNINIKFDQRIDEEKGVQLHLRKKMHLIKKQRDPFILLVSKMIQPFLPLSFIENYKKIRDEISKNKNLKKKKKIIFTSNLFGKGDKYNIWIAEKVQQGSKYIVGQHGQGYLEYYDKFSRVEFRTCDKFISWGNRKFSNKIKPLFNFKTWGVEKKNIQNKKKILIITRSSGTQITHYDRWELGNGIFSKTKILIERIDLSIKKNLVLKLHKNYKKRTYPEFDKFLSRKSDLSIKKDESFKELVDQSRLVVFNDYSTGFLECLSIDHPTLCLFANKLNFIHSSNKKDFEMLEKNNLIFFSEIKLASFINDNFKNIELWWNSEKIKKIKKNFCTKYSKKSYKGFFKNYKKFSIELN